MKLHTLKSTPGSRVEKHRVGRGHVFAGKGKQAGKGQSGQNKRHGHRLGFEGGQTPVIPSYW
nr:uL15 family ribosomal protein [Mycoplasmopsis bovis]